MNKIKRTKKQIEASRKSIKIATKVSTQNSELQRAKRMKQIKDEEDWANQLRKEGYEVYSPTVVCDRIAVKNGEVFFVEFKKRGQGLREGQKRISDLVGKMYLVIFK